MEPFKLKILETVIALVLVFISLKTMHYFAEKMGRKFNYHRTRVKIVRKISFFISMLVITVVIAFIWGIKAAQLASYIASLFTVLGIAFVAQWSLLSNITATLIIFFNKQVHIGDHIQIMDKDYAIEGEISDVGVFFTVIKTMENEYISLPSNVFIQKMVKKKKRIEEEDHELIAETNHKQEAED